jgi:CRP-like cAMP-binding protein
MSELTNLEDLEKRTVASGEAIIEEGAAGSDIFVLISGEVSVIKSGKELCRISGDQSVFGEISSFFNQPYSATVQTETECSFYIINDVKTYLEANPKSALYFTEVLAKRLITMNNHFVEIKSEIEELQDSSDKDDVQVQSKISQLLSKMDGFWGTEVFPEDMEEDD